MKIQSTAAGLAALMALAGSGVAQAQDLAAEVRLAFAAASAALCCEI